MSALADTGGLAAAAETARGLETRAVLAAAALAALAVSIAPRGPVLAGVAAACVLAGAAAALSAGRRPPRALSLLTAAAIALVLNAVFTAGAPLVIAGRSWPVSAAGVAVGVDTALRLVALVTLFHGATSAVAPLEAVALLDRAARPLARFGVRHDAPAVLLLVTLRLWPVIEQEGARLVRQRALRAGWPGPGLDARARARRLRLGWRMLAALLVPLTLLVLRRAEQVAAALPARYYGLAPRTPAALRRWRGREWTVVTVAAAAVVLAAGAR